MVHRSSLLSAGLIVAVGLLLSGCSLVNDLSGGVTRDDEGNVTEGNENADVFSIVVGDCLGDAVQDGVASTAAIVPCDEPHAAEVYYSHVMADGAYPGSTAIDTESSTACTGPAYSRFVGLNYNDSVLLISTYSPTEQSWASGDREILCLISAPEGVTTGSLEGSAR